MIGRLKLWAAAAAVFVTALLASWLGGRKSAQNDAKVEELDSYVRTRKNMDDVVVGDDPDLARRWLRERGKRPGGM